MIERIDHVSLAVRDIKKAREFFCGVLGLVPTASSILEEMKYLGEVFAAGDLTRIEMITPTGDGTFLDKFLKEREGVHHLCFQVLDIEAAKRSLEEKGVPFFGYNAEGDWKELFIHPLDAFGVLVQIAQFDPAEFLIEPFRFPEGKKWEVTPTDKGISLTIAHPGGGKATVELTREEARGLAQSIMSGLESSPHPRHPGA